MEFKEIVAPSMKELFIKNIESLILSKQLKIGEKLPPERELASQMKISRTIVNLGLSELAKKGFIDIHPRQGVYVADYIRKGNLETLLSLVNFNGGHLDKVTFSSLAEFRINVEGHVYELAAKNRTDADLEILQNHIEEIHNYSSIDGLSESIYQFHHSVFCASKNYIYPLVHNGLEFISKRLTSLLFENVAPDFVVLAIDELFEYIKAGDEENSKRAIHDLVEKGVQLINSSFFKNYV